MKKLVSATILGALFATCVALGASAQSTDAQRIVGPGAVWQDAERFAEKIGECRELVTPKSQECLIRMIRDSGADGAADFSARIQGEGYLRSFRKAGPVDIAYVEYPFRANQNNGILLVNGNPPFIDVDDSQALPKKDMERDPAYKAILRKFPEPMLFAGDRFSADIPTVEPLAGGGQIFTVPYRLTNVCRACELLAMVRFGFDFDANGKLLGIRYVGLERSETPAQSE